MYSFLVLALSCACATVQACQREHLAKRDSSHQSLQQALHRRQETSTAFPPSLTAEQAVLIRSFHNVTIDQWSYYYTHGLHLAGTNKSMAQWTADRWGENGFTSGLASYYTFLNYPVHQSLSLTLPDGTTKTIALEEDSLDVDPTTTWPNRVPSFHGYSWSGNASAEFVYVGRGQQVDFERLEALGIDLKGKIALSRYGGPFRGLKVKNAQDRGMIGCITYTDLADDGNNTILNGIAAYPDGPARNPSTVQRGSVMFLSTYPGDPTTPGYPSKEDSPRADRSLVTPHIPSLPLSWRSSLDLLQALEGHGVSGSEVNRTRWIGAANTSYYTGPAPGATLSMSNQMREEITWIWDSIGYINGTEYPDEVLIIGNHRDAWIIGGAADPNSGSAVLVELTRAFNALMKTGWRPKRTILLGSWDGEEYGMLGSTEWVEEYLPWLVTTGVAYLNLDIATSGPEPDLSATPDLHHIATETMKKIVYPYRNMTNVTLYDVWYAGSQGEIGVLGSGSDFTSFLHAAGISSLDTGAGGAADDPIYPYHSNYDSYHWMTTFGDPNYNTHKVIGQYTALLAYEIASRDILPFEPSNYGIELTKYLTDLTTDVQQHSESSSTSTTTTNTNTTLDLQPLHDAIATFNASAATLDALIATNPSDVDTLRLINGKLRDYQRGFISQGGLPTREFYKHIAFAPGLDTGYAPVTYPGITEAVEAGDWDTALDWVGRTARAIEKAAAILQV